MKLINAFFVFAVCFTFMGNKAAEPSVAPKIITVRDGLPQSYVSGIIQDQNGFLWIATLNGLGRYDGRQFKTYQHTSANTSGLSGNIILHLFNAGNNNLWLCYLDDKIDQLNTITGQVTHLWQNKSFGLLKDQAGFFKSMVRDNHDVCWMMAKDGGLYSIDQHTHIVKHFSITDIRLNEPVIGINLKNKRLMLYTKTHLAICNSAGAVVKNIPYPFKITRPNNTVQNIYSAHIRANGDLIINDTGGITIWNPESGLLKTVPLKRITGPGKLIANFDKAGNFFFEFNNGVFLLKPNNTLIPWAPSDQVLKGTPTSIYADRSGVLWVGTNGFGLRKYNLVNTGLPGYLNHYSFMGDALIKTGVPVKQVTQTFLNSTAEFADRSTTYKDSVWVADVTRLRADPELMLSVKKQASVKVFHNQDVNVKKEMHSIWYLATDNSGKLWAADEHYRFLKFDTKKLTYKVCGKAVIDEHEMINGMMPDEGVVFYISTTRSLCRVNVLTGETEKLTSFLPSNDLLNISNDPDDKDVLWIGTLSDGLMRFNKQTHKVQVFSTTTGLPNNTVYCVLPGNDNLLWCSSNKGIFAFNKKTQAVRSFTSRDGLTDDEFNRFYFMQLPGGNLAFGGSLGYTVFNPSKLETDQFDPQVVLTDLNVINMPHLPDTLSTVKELHLKYDQNFITAVFAAMQFDIPEKLQYRYKLKGLDNNWIMLGNENKASYTSLPPGTYTLMLNATNTAGKWGTYIPQIKIIISPPFWRTWWFYLGIFLGVIAIFYIVLKLRIRSIKKVQDQKLHFEREAMELHALALRARMNPHFIFNCLNSIKALIQEKHNQKAVNYLTTFATLIRKQLNNKSNEITLQDELETCKLYLQLEAMRFEERITFNIEIPDDEQLQQTRVPPLILQPIVENAIVHGLLPAEHGGQVNIKVYRDDRYAICKIQDNGIGREAAQINKQKSSRLHQSKGINLLEERIAIHNRMNDHVGSLETTDLYNDDGRPAGTLVIIKFNIDL